MTWYYMDGTNRKGPFDDAQWESLIARGEIDGGTWVWREGMSGWKPYANVAERKQEPAPGPANNEHRFCQSCGQKNAENNYRCVRCGFVLHGPAPLPRKVGDTAFDRLIPKDNPSALISYYCGVFSLIPLVGIPLGLVAVGLGIAGLSVARTDPRSVGRTHARVGIILGALCSIAYTVLAVVIVIHKS